jgi:hypothetical protein
MLVFQRHIAPFIVVSSLDSDDASHLQRACGVNASGFQFNPGRVLYSSPINP